MGNILNPEQSGFELTSSVFPVNINELIICLTLAKRIFHCCPDQRGVNRRLHGLAVACWITDNYHLCSNLRVGIHVGCFIFVFASLPLAYHVHKRGRKTSIIIIPPNYL